MREEVHLPYSLDGFNVCLELVPNTRGHLKTAADLVPKSMRCHVVLPTSVVPVIQEKTVNCPQSRSPRSSQLIGNTASHSADRRSSQLIGEPVVDFVEAVLGDVGLRYGVHPLVA